MFNNTKRVHPKGRRSLILIAALAFSFMFMGSAFAQVGIPSLPTPLKDAESAIQIPADVLPPPDQTLPAQLPELSRLPVPAIVAADNPPATPFPCDAPAEVVMHPVRLTEHGAPRPAFVVEASPPMQPPTATRARSLDDLEAEAQEASILDLALQSPASLAAPPQTTSHARVAMDGSLKVLETPLDAQMGARLYLSNLTASAAPRWIDLGPLPCGVHDAIVAAHGNTLFVIGGVRPDGVATTQTWTGLLGKHHRVDGWVQGPALPMPISSGVARVHGTTLLVDHLDARGMLHTTVADLTRSGELGGWRPQGGPALPSGPLPASQRESTLTLAGLPPVADAGPDVTGTVGHTFTFNGSRSVDPDGTVVAHAWDFGDGTMAPGAETAHSFAAVGAYNVVLTVTDDSGLVGSDNLTAFICPDAQALIDNAVAGSTLTLPQCRYAQPLWINKTLTLSAEPGTVFDGRLGVSSNRPGPAINIQSNDVTLTGFQITNWGQAVQGYHATNVRLTGLSFANNGQSAFFCCDQNALIEIDHNQFLNDCSSYGYLYAYYVTTHVHDNAAPNCFEFYAYYGTNVQVDHNVFGQQAHFYLQDESATFDSNTLGFSLYGSFKGATVSNNRNADGSGYHYWSFSGQTTFVHNTLSPNGDENLYFYGANSLIANNHLNPTYLNVMSSGDQTTFRLNNFSNTCGSCGLLQLTSSATNNAVYLNNFLNNTRASDSGTNNRFDTGSLGNYWSQHNAQDSDANGIADTPYTGIEGNAGTTDRYPLMYPFVQGSMATPPPPMPTPEMPTLMLSALGAVAVALVFRTRRPRRPA